MTPCRDALQVFSASLRKPAQRYGYRGLKIFTSLSLRFQDFQRMALFLLSDKSSWITGQILKVDGGMSAIKM
ncbi:Transposase OrfAB, subunit B [Methylomonas albis]|nr:Transposase OrfAB, subunit B [Methylomonas albis]